MAKKTIDYKVFESSIVDTWDNHQERSSAIREYAEARLLKAIDVYSTPTSVTPHSRIINILINNLRSSIERMRLQELIKQDLIQLDDCGMPLLDDRIGSIDASPVITRRSGVRFRLYSWLYSKLMKFQFP